MEATPDDPHAMVTATGEYVKHIMHAHARAQGKVERPPNWDDDHVTTHLVDLEPLPALQIPDELKCPLCTELMREAVLIQCCGNSFCDECIRNNLLDSESKECPVCHKTDMSPEELVPNLMLRQAVTKFLNDTGYAHYARRRLAAEDAAGASPVDGNRMR